MIGFLSAVMFFLQRLSGEFYGFGGVYECGVYIYYCILILKQRFGVDGLVFY